MFTDLSLNIQAHLRRLYTIDSSTCNKVFHHLRAEKKNADGHWRSLQQCTNDVDVTTDSALAEVTGLVQQAESVKLDPSTQTRPLIKSSCLPSKAKLSVHLQDFSAVCIHFTEVHLLLTEEEENDHTRSRVRMAVRQQWVRRSRLATLSFPSGSLSCRWLQSTRSLFLLISLYEPI